MRLMAGTCICKRLNRYFIVTGIIQLIIMQELGDYLLKISCYWLPLELQQIVSEKYFYSVQNIYIWSIILSDTMHISITNIWPSPAAHPPTPACEHPGFKLQTRTTIEQDTVPKMLKWYSSQSGPRSNFVRTGSGSEQLLTSRWHQNRHILNQFCTFHSHEPLLSPVLLFPLSPCLPLSDGSPCSVCITITPPQHTHAQSQIWSHDLLKDARIQSDSFVSDAVRRFEDTARRFMTPERHLALTQGGKALLMQHGVLCHPWHSWKRRASSARCRCTWTRTGTERRHRCDCLWGIHLKFRKTTANKVWIKSRGKIPDSTDTREH